jgi:hypothetical protein
VRRNTAASPGTREIVGDAAVFRGVADRRFPLSFLRHETLTASPEGSLRGFVLLKGKMITIVSGLPRSGTSLMMQMLDAGGLPVLSDGERKADTDNPRGYLEWERIKQLPKAASLIVEAEGKAVKVISHLLLSLPENHEYHVVFMQRPLPEVLKSQDEMLRRRGAEASNTGTAAIEEAFQRHLIEVNKWLGTQSNMKVLRVHYHRVLREPRAVAVEVASFLPVPLDVEAMVGQVDGSLYRNRMK